MTKKQTKKIKRYFDKGYLIFIKDYPYVDGKVRNIYEENGELVYDNDVFKGRPLQKVFYNTIIIAEPIKELKWKK